MFLVQGGLQTFAIFMPQIAEETGWPVSQVAIVSTTATIGAFLANMILPIILKKLNAKMVLLIGAFLLMAHNIMYSLCGSVYLLWVAGFIGGFAIGWGTAAPCTIIMTNWFVKNRSQYVAIIVAASMFGSVILNPVAGNLIASFGWRTAYQIQGVVVGGIAFLAVLLLIIDSPAKKGQLAYGAEEAANLETAAAKEVGGLEPADARKSMSFWLLVIGIFCIGLSTNIENFMPTFWQASGLSAVTSSYIMSAYAFEAAIGSIIMSKINDKLGGKNFVLITSILFAVAVLLMSWTGVVSSLPLLIICCIPFAIGGKKASSLTPPLVVAEAFGTKNYAIIIGTFTAMLQLGIAASNIVIGKLLPLGYPVTFTAMVVINIVGMACMFIALLKKPYKGE